MQKCSQRSTRIATLIVLVSFAVSCRGWKTSVKAMMHRLSAINAHYMDPESHAATSSRGMCTGFTQVETLKGVWVTHPHLTYKGISSPKECPIFARDYDCRGEYINATYQSLGEQEFSKVFKPHACELQPWSAQHFNQCLQGRRIIMIGDSTMRQMYQSLACLLHEHVQDGYLMDVTDNWQNWDQANASHVTVPFEREYTIPHEPGTNVHKQFVGTFSLQNGVTVSLRSFGILNITLWDDVMAEFLPLTSHDVILVEFGAWYPRFSPVTAVRTWRNFVTDMKELFSERLRKSPASVLWRAYSPSHFGGDLGGYEIEGTPDEWPDSQLTSCQPASKGEYFYDTEIIRYLQDDCGASCNHIHMLPIYHLSLLAHNSHHGSFGSGLQEKRIDCRHFCSNIIDVWNLVLYNKLCFE